jgi:hypothetical protein
MAPTRCKPVSTRARQREHGLHRTRCMRTKAQRVERKPVGAAGVGIGAGAALLAVMCLDAGVRGESAYTPFSLTASLVLGESASHSDAPATLLVGLIIGTAAATFNGFVFAQLLFRFPDLGSRGWVTRLVTGMLFGTAVYVFAFQVIGRLAFPWVLHADQPAWLAGHALFFGPLLAVMHHVALVRERERLRQNAIDPSAPRTRPHGNPTGQSS